MDSRLGVSKLNFVAAYNTHTQKKIIKSTWQRANTQRFQTIQWQLYLIGSSAQQQKLLKYIFFYSNVQKEKKVIERSMWNNGNNKATEALEKIASERNEFKWIIHVLRSCYLYRKDPFFSRYFVSSAARVQHIFMNSASSSTSMFVRFFSVHTMQ